MDFYFDTRLFRQHSARMILTPDETRHQKYHFETFHGGSNAKGDWRGAARAL
jgi:hypothetical protein